MAAMTNFLENKLVDWFFRAKAIGITGATAGAGSGPANLYIGLMTAVADGDGGSVTEVSTTSTNYGRQTVVSSTTNWAATNGAGTTTDPSSGTTATTSNNAAITFGAPSGNWGTVTHFGIWDAVSGGNLLFWGALTQSKTVNNGDAAPSFAISALSVQLDN